MHAIGDLGAVLGIWAHPDDETYLSGGLMAAAVDHGLPVACVTATAGEKGTDDPERWPPDKLARRRRRELTDALSMLGVDDHAWLDYQDGHCADVPVEEAVARLVDIVERFRPDTILTFGPDGVTGHPDHVAVGRWADLAAAEAAPHARVLAAAKDADWVRRFADLHRQHDVSRPGYPIPTAADELTVRLDLPEALLDRKVAALRAQTSQTAPLIDAFGHDRWREWIRTEAFAPVNRTH